MKEKPWEEALQQKLSELPLPGENESWEKMKVLLYEKKKRRAFLLFRNEKAIGGTLLLLLLCLWLYISPEKIRKPLVASASFHQTTATQKTDDKKNKSATPDEAITEPNAVSQKSNPVSHSSTAQTTGRGEMSSSQSSFSSNKNGENGVVKKAPDKKKDRLSIKKSTLSDPAVVADAGNGAFNKKDSSYADILQDKAAPNQDINIAHDSTPLLVDINEEASSSVRKNKDSSSESLIRKDSLQLPVNNTAATANIIVRKHNPFFIDAGIGIKQPLPVGGQKFVSYNDTVNKQWLSDYTPFLYMRLEKKGQWFVQGEFHYASPRLVNPFTYYQKTTPDYNHGSTTTMTYQLQKTWYMQVPLSLNIYLRPSWSAGAGVVYNRLNDVLSKQEMATNNIVAGTHVSGALTLPVAHFTDSFLYKTNTSLSLQTDYQKGRWSLGLRYLYDLQPYLTYTLPDGERKDKRNASLELMIRYRFYRLAAFRLEKR